MTDTEIVLKYKEMLEAGTLPLVRPHGGIGKFARAVTVGYLDPVDIFYQVSSVELDGSYFFLIDDDYARYLVVFENSTFVFWNDDEPDGIHPDLISAHLISKIHPSAKVQVVLDEETKQSRMRIELNGKSVEIFDQR